MGALIGGCSPLSHGLINISPFVALGAFIWVGCLGMQLPWVLLYGRLLWVLSYGLVALGCSFPGCSYVVGCFGFFHMGWLPWDAVALGALMW